MKNKYKAISTRSLV